MTRIRNIATSGVLIEIQGVKLLVDPFSLLENGHYPFTTPEDLHAMLHGLAPFDQVHLLFLSHDHWDHFHADYAAQLLLNQHDICLLAPPIVVEQILEKLPAGLAPERILLADPALYHSVCLPFRGLQLQAVRTLHMGQEYTHTIHLSLLIQGCHTIFLAGDAVASENNFSSVLIPDELDVLVAPFPYLTIPSYRKAVNHYLQPKQQIVVHMPLYEGEGVQWTDQTLVQAEKLKDKGMLVEVFQQPGQIMTFDSTQLL